MPMSKIPGIGELLEGVLERDPLDDTYRIRVGDDSGQRVVHLRDVLAEYEGSEVRFTIAFAKSLAAAVESFGGEGASPALTFDGAAKGN